MTKHSILHSSFQPSRCLEKPNFLGIYKVKTACLRKSYLIPSHFRFHVFASFCFLCFVILKHDGLYFKKTINTYHESPAGVAVDQLMSGFSFGKLSWQQAASCSLSFSSWGSQYSCFIFINTKSHPVHSLTSSAESVTLSETGIFVLPKKITN